MRFLRILLGLALLGGTAYFLWRSFQAGKPWERIPPRIDRPPIDEIPRPPVDEIPRPPALSPLERCLKECIVEGATLLQMTHCQADCMRRFGGVTSPPPPTPPKTRLEECIELCLLVGGEVTVGAIARCQERCESVFGKPSPPRPPGTGGALIL